MISSSPETTISVNAIGREVSEWGDDIQSAKLDFPGLNVAKKQPVLLSEGMAEVTAMAIRTDITSKDHFADLGLVARVADDWAELLNSMSKLTLVAV
ncbi:hypothetical protein SADUNF_Sadunf10G0076000 [Salix dunnii]|uniref:Uncharacterized protein n=1 Tax=Salix dunnii TaxID=1413687 RepID=A0A835MQG0_9ROSI|nr:hypothetical protein SADUNF_Sadunf10G0076000 [Salix dunnii]